MRCAPPVQMSCTRSARWQWLSAVIWGTAAGGIAGWAALWFEWVAPVAASVAAALVGAAMSGQVLGHRCDRLLAWDGTRWTLDGREGTARLAIDLGRWLLVRFDAAGAGIGRTCWLPVELGAAGAPAHRCRAALVAATAGVASPAGSADV